MEARAARQQEQARQEALIPGELVILFDEDLSPADQDRVLAKHDLVPVRRGLRGDSATVHVTPGSEQRLLRALSDEPAVAAAEQNLLMLPMGHEDPATPNDPFYYAQDWHFSMVQAEEAWHTTRGANVIVGVVDTGVAFEDYTNPQTQDVFKKSPDLSPDTFIWPNDLIQGTNHPNDNFGHGSHVTGTIAAITDNAREGAGIAYEALVVPARVCGMVPDPLDDTPPIRLVYGCPEDLIADGMEWALLQGARVINVSLGGPASGAKQRAAVARAEAAGAIIVAASGNGGNDLIGDALLAYPSALKGVLAVGAVGMDGIRTSYSNYGQGEDGKALDLVAPGGDTDDPVGVVQNSYVQFCEQFRAGTVTDFTRFATCGYRGTSMAAAHASAVAALIFSAYPALTRDQVFDVLRCSARDVGAPGYDPEYGHGIVQAADALRDSDSDGTPDCLDGEIPPPVNTCGPKLTPTPGPAIAARPIARGMPTPVPTPTDTPAPTPESTPSPPVKDTPTPNPGTPTPGPETPTPPAGTSTAEPTPTATRTPTATPTAIATPPPPPTPATPTPLDFACGDVDCDGDVDAVDALWIMRFVVGLQPSAPCLGNGYAYCTAEITIVDALTVLRYVAGLPLNLPPGCPNVGYEL